MAEGSIVPGYFIYNYYMLSQFNMVGKIVGIKRPVTLTPTLSPTRNLTRTATRTQTTTPTPTRTQTAMVSLTPTMTPTRTASATRTPVPTGTPTPNASLSGMAWTFYYLTGSERVAMRVVDAGSDQLYYLFTDHLGSTSEVRNADGSLHSAQGYKAFGEVWYRMGSLPTGRTYTGQTEIEYGLLHYGARTYDPGLARWVQPDTIIPQPGNPMAWDRFEYGLNNPSRYTDPTGHFTEDEIQQYFGVDSWDDVLKVFQEGGALEGRWGWLTVLQKAELGDEICINWDVDQLPNDHPGAESSFKGKFELDKSGRLIITGESNYMDQIKAAKYGSNYVLMHYTSDDAKKGAAAFLIAVTDITVGIPAFGLILSGQPHLMKAGEALETLVVLPVNVLGVKMWRDAEHSKLEEVLNVSAIPDQNVPHTPYRNQEPN